MEKISFYSLNLEDLRALFIENGFKAFSANQLFGWIYKKRVYDPELWTNISKGLKEFINEKMDLTLPKIVWQGESRDGTRKFLVGMNDGQTVEAVAIPAKDRLTLCLSSQVGCAIGCTFCHTGTMGLKRHLTTDEIVGQLLATEKWMRDNVDPQIRYTNMVYMGQGEPLHNYENIKTATEIFLNDLGLGFGQRRITLSTSGLVPQIKKLADFPPVNLAISLHAAHDDVRTELMPINKVYDLKRLFEALRSIPLKAYRRITYEYILIKDLNDQMKDVEGLLSLLDKRKSKVNLIPFNEYPESQFKRPSDKQIMWFQKQLLDNDVVCTIRTTKGADILAACGQLKSEQEKGKLNLWEKESLQVN